MSEYIERGALLKAFRESGYLTFEVGTIFNPLEEIIYNFLGLRNGEKINLAELFGAGKE